MKITGWILVLLGLLFGLSSLITDQLIESSLSSSAQSRDYIITAGILFFSGALLVIISGRQSKAAVYAAGDREELRYLLKNYHLINRLKVNPAIIEEMEIIRDRRLKLDYHLESDKTTEFIHIYREDLAVKIVRLLDNIEGITSSPNKK